VAGYPADQLQKAFNILQTSKDRDLKSLPNLPENMPESYYDMLEGLLVYRHKRRKTAAEMLSHEFVSFWKDLEEEEDGISFEAIAAAAASGKEAAQDQSLSKKMGKSQSIALSGSVWRHTLMLGYQKFERSVTTLLATMLNSTEFDRLLSLLEDRKKGGEKGEEIAGTGSTATVSAIASPVVSSGADVESDETVNRERLDVVQIHALKTIIKEEFSKNDM